MFDPRFIWTGIAVLGSIVLINGYMKSASQKNDGEKTAFVIEKNGSQSNVRKLTRRDCLAQPNHLWVEIPEGVECLSYLAPGQKPSSDVGIVYFQGDFPVRQQSSQKMSAARRSYQRTIDRLSNVTGTSYFVLARPGIMGSSGAHIIGGQASESQIMWAALDQLKKRYGFSNLVLAGQSGGARLVAQQLVSGRADIKCAVMGSGAYGVPRVVGGGRKRTDIWGNPGNRYLVPLQHTQNIVRDRRRRIYVIGDPKDQRTPFPEQRQWANELSKLGHHVELIEATARGKEHHGHSATALAVAGLCAKGKDDRTIREHAVKVSGRISRTNAPRAWETRNGQ